MEGIDEFIHKLEVEIEDFGTGVLKPETNYRDLENWSSMHALIIIAFADTDYDVTLTGDDLRKCDTVQDLYDVIHARTGQAS